jgi:transposase
MTERSKTQLYADIRRDARAGVGVRELQRRYRVGWATVNAATQAAWPAARARYSPRLSKLDVFKEVIDAILVEDLDAPRKQRHTARRIFARLLDEHGMTGVSYDVVRRYVKERRQQIRAEHGRGEPGVFIAQTHHPGREAEVDFGDAAIYLAGELVTVHVFSFRMSYSGKAVHRAFLTGGQEAFFEGHVHAFHVLGGVPAGRIKYDNLKAAVAQVIGFSRQRVETDRWIAFCSHWDIDPWYCQPGQEGAHEKGGVEGDVGWFRRNHLVPVPRVDSIAELNALIEGYDDTDDKRRIGARIHTVGDGVRSRTHAAQTGAGGALRNGAVVDPAGGPVRPGHGPLEPVLGAGALDRAAGAGSAARLDIGGLRGAGPGDRARTTARQGTVPAGPGSLSGGVDPQTGSVARVHRPGAGQGRRNLHRHA